MRLAVVSHVPHYRLDGRLWAYGPYVAEMEEWARLFDEVVIVAPEGRGPVRGDQRAFGASNVKLAAVREAGGRGWRAKLGLVTAAAEWAAAAWREMGRADVVQVRCPGNVGLVGAALAPLRGRPMIAKYAGQWGSYPGEAWSYKAQRWLLRRMWRRGLVLVYAAESRERHLRPFFNSALTAEHLERARTAAEREREGGRVLFVGRLTAAKGAETAIRACAALGGRGRQVRLEVAGEGPERARLEALAAELGVEARFHGGVGFEAVLGLYEQADVLVLPSRTEGWPKVLAEAMAFGVPCVATRGGLNGWMLGEGRGLTVEFGDAEALAGALERLLGEPVEQKRERRRRCAEFGQRYTLEGVRAGIESAIREVLGGVSRKGGAAREGTRPEAERAVGVMHMVDTLEAGGAETMCVLLANALAGRGWRTHVCATRRGGPLEARIGEGVRLLRLERRGRFDAGAVARLRAYVEREGIGLLHAHGTAVFLAVAVRMLGAKVRVVWHDHYGRHDERPRPGWLYGVLRGWVDGVVAVNGKLAEWAVREAGFRRERVWVVPNFAAADGAEVAEGLPGVAGCRVAQVANVRPQKDHAMMLRAMRRVLREVPQAHLLVVGQCGTEGHGGRVRRLAAELGLDGAVSFLGAREDVGAVLRGCDVGVLSSASEGLPVALLEYGEAGLAVACTDVGDCRKVVEGCGVLVPPGDDVAMAEAVAGLLRDAERRAELGRRLQERVRREWSREAAVGQVEEVYGRVLGAAV